MTLAMEKVAGLLGESPAAERIRQFAAEAASTDLPVLLQGETGTGKSFLAQVIHQQSRRACGPFVPVDLATIPRELLPAELFGCTKGAFTGAEAKPGLVRAAASGTLFLDEIGNAPQEVQACLLQLLDGKTVRALGSERLDRVDCRFMAATKENLKAQVAHGRFRNDLFFRLRGHVLTLPPLRERGDDVLLVARQWLAQMSGDNLRLSPSAARLMRDHSWPGNFRELRHRLEVAVRRCQNGVIEPEDLGLPGTDPGLPLPAPHPAERATQSSPEALVDQLVAAILAGRVGLPHILEQLERKTMSLAIQQTESLRAAARRLQLPYSTVQTKLERLAQSTHETRDERRVVISSRSHTFGRTGKAQA